MVDLAIEKEQGCLPSEDGGPMARRTFDVIDVAELLGALACGPVAERDVRFAGGGPKDDPQVRCPGARRGYRAGRACEERGRVA